MFGGVQHLLLCQRERVFFEFARHVETVGKETIERRALVPHGLRAFHRGEERRQQVRELAADLFHLRHAFFAPGLDAVAERSEERIPADMILFAVILELFQIRAAFDRGDCHEARLQTGRHVGRAAAAGGKAQQGGDGLDGGAVTHRAFLIRKQGHAHLAADPAQHGALTCHIFGQDGDLVIAEPLVPHERQNVCGDGLRLGERVGAAHEADLLRVARIDGGRQGVQILFQVGQFGRQRSRERAPGG